MIKLLILAVLIHYPFYGANQHAPKVRLRVRVDNLRFCRTPEPLMQLKLIARFENTGDVTVDLRNAADSAVIFASNSKDALKRHDFELSVFPPTMLPRVGASVAPGKEKLLHPTQQVDVGMPEVSVPLLNKDASNRLKPGDHFLFVETVFRASHEATERTISSEVLRFVAPKDDDYVSCTPVYKEP